MDNKTITYLLLNQALLVLSTALLLVSVWASRPRTIHAVIGVLIWGPGLSPRLRRRFVGATVCYVLSITGWIAFFCLTGRQFGWTFLYDGLIAFTWIGIALLTATGLFAFIRRVAGFLPAVYLARIRRHEEMLTVGFAAVMGLLMWFLVFPIADHFRVG
jgi:hypothetical protein